MENRKNLTLVIIAAAVIIIIIFFYYWWSKRGAVSPENLDTALEEAAIETSVAPPSTNPLEAVTPAGNPVEKTNPFKYENPFE